MFFMPNQSSPAAMLVENGSNGIETVAKFGEAFLEFGVSDSFMGNRVRESWAWFWECCEQFPGVGEAPWDCGRGLCR